MEEFPVSNPAPPIEKIVLAEQPEFERHSFTVTITLSDGNSFVMKTGDVYLQNPDEEQR